MALHIVATGCALLAVFSFYLGSTATSGTERPGQHTFITGYLRGIIMQSTIYAFGGLLLTIACIFQMLSYRDNGGEPLSSDPVIPLVIGLSVYLTMCISIPACRIYHHLDRQEKTASTDADAAATTAEKPKIRGRIAPNDTASDPTRTTNRSGSDIMFNVNG